MPYNNNVPQSNQTIASTTDPIRDNFAFIQTDLQAEHSFNGNALGVAEGAHLQASMPNLAADPGALPAGTNGMYYVRNGGARFYDGTTISRLTEGLVAANGYQWIGKVLFQWGSGNTVNALVNFPIAFPTGVFSFVPGTAGPPATVTIKVATLSTTQFSVSGTALTNYYWMAVGY